jgi:Protein of unknown function (DUF2510)
MAKERSVERVMSHPTSAYDPQQETSKTPDSNFAGLAQYRLLRRDMTTPQQPGWYDDPNAPNAQRYWDGQDWTPHRRRNPTAAPASPPTQPQQQAPPPPPPPNLQPPPPPSNLPPVAPPAHPLPPPPAQEQPPAAPRGKFGVSKAALVLAGLALLLAIAAVVAGRVELGTFLPGILVVVAIAAIAAFFTLRSNRSGARKAMLVTATVLVVAVAIPASLKVVYPAYNRFFGQKSAESSSAGTASPGSGPEGSGPGAGPGSGPGAPSNGSTGGGAKSGIVVMSYDGNDTSFGYIDPSTGKYAHVSTFKGEPGGSDPLEEVSPDLSRIVAVHKDNDPARYITRAGWVDTSGKFTAVSPAPSPAADFQQSAPPIYEGPVFDRAGNFYYWERQGTTSHLYKLPAGSTSNPQEVTPTPKSTGGSPLRNFDGTLHFGCPFIPGQWLGPDSRMAVSTTTGLPGSPADSSSNGWAVVKYPVTTAADGCPAVTQNNQDATKVFDIGIQTVDQPVPNPDGTKIAFYNSNSPGGLYVLSIGGNSKPTRIATRSDLNLPNMKLIGWT